VLAANLPACKKYEQQDRSWGDAVTKFGEWTAAAGWGGAGLSALAGGVGIFTVDPALAYYGGQGFDGSIAIIAAGNALQAAGATLNAIGGRGTPLTRTIVNEVVAKALGNSPPIVKDLVKQGLDKIEEHLGDVVPQTCRTLQG
jgi:hypothetical protein